MPDWDSRRTEDTRLIELALQGHTRSYEALVRNHLRRAYAVALAETGEPADAEDVCQDAFVVVLERLEECRDPARFTGWLLEIVRNRARDARRHREVRTTLPIEAAPHDAANSPSHDAERAEMRAFLRTALETLTDRQREVFLLHDLEGWKHREIGEQLGLSAGAARVHLHHARRALRALLAPFYAGETQR